MNKQAVEWQDNELDEILIEHLYDILEWEESWDFQQQPVNILIP